MLKISEGIPANEHAPQPLFLDDSFCLEDAIMMIMASEKLASLIDVGPTDAVPDRTLQLEYDAFFGTSPLSSPTPSPPTSRPPSPGNACALSALPLPLAHAISPLSSTSRPPSPSAPPPSLSAAISTNLPQSDKKRRRGKKRKCSRSPPHPQRAASSTSPGEESGQNAAEGDLEQRAGRLNSKARRDRRKAHSRRTAVRRDERAEDPAAGRMPRPATVTKHIAPAERIAMTLDAADFPTASTGFVSLPDQGGRVHDLQDLLEVRKFKLIKRTSKKPTAIVDASGRVIAVFVGEPDDPEWEKVHESAFASMMDSATRCEVPKKAKKNRRGKFAALNAGISFGGGQMAPGNLRHPSAINAEELKKLTSDKSMTRIAGFASSAFAAWAPKLHRYYDKSLEALLSHHPGLSRNFSNSVWSAAAFNFGPRTVTAKHRDYANLPFGWCGITALGHYDYTKGGHIVLWELQLVMEFPPGSTILLPSSAVSHSNTPIAKHETRCSFTQYTAGGLFRWVEHGFQTEPNFWGDLSELEREGIPAQNQARCKLGLSLFSTLDELTSCR